jgi:prepilin-type N-terminal cleavage/methylation domain-containing protein
MRKRTGFTLVELLVVIAIIGVLVALLLPAVQAAREAARRAQCTNNLKQIGLGLANYESGLGQLPTQFAPYDEAGVDGNGISWMVQILPFIEQQSLFGSIDSTGKMSAREGMIRQQNYPALETPIDVYFCPSDPLEETTVDDAWQATGIPLGVTNYAGVLGPHDLGNGSIFGGLPDCHNYTSCQNAESRGRQEYCTECSGTFWRHSHLAPVSLESFADGLSNTMIVGEVLPEFDAFKYWPLSSGTYASTHLSPTNLGLAGRTK